MQRLAFTCFVLPRMAYWAVAAACWGCMDTFALSYVTRMLPTALLHMLVQVQPGTQDNQDVVVLTWMLPAMCPTLNLLRLPKQEAEKDIRA